MFHEPLTISHATKYPGAREISTPAHVASQAVAQPCEFTLNDRSTRRITAMLIGAVSGLLSLDPGQSDDHPRRVEPLCAAFDKTLTTVARRQEAYARARLWTAGLRELPR
jgi:hypothetical protein